MERSAPGHIPVMADEVISYLRLKEGMVIADCTLGAGGHALRILELIGEKGLLVGLDADEEALSAAAQNLKKFENQIKLLNKNFRYIKDALASLNIEKIDGAVFDLGISSYQLDSAERGFGIRSDGPLDMRMDRSAPLTAADIVNRYSRAELADIFRKYGDEGRAFKIADFILARRRSSRIGTTAELAEIVCEAKRAATGFYRIHPATKVFMALRIAVNDELNSLRMGLEGVMPFLKSRGRICVVSFHSIEDRLVKNFFRERAKKGELKIVTKKPVRPQGKEKDLNPRSRSARLRAAERT